jgi:hypothetical protein
VFPPPVDPVIFGWSVPALLLAAEPELQAARSTASIRPANAATTLDPLSASANRGRTGASSKRITGALYRLTCPGSMFEPVDRMPEPGDLIEAFSP